MNRKAQEIRNHPCSGCRSWHEYAGEQTCIDLVVWHGDVPIHPPCRVTAEEYAAAELDIDEQVARQAEKLRELAAALPGGALLRMAQTSAVEAKLQGDELMAAHYIAVGANLLAAQGATSHAPDGSAQPSKAKRRKTATLQLVPGGRQ